jgi:hypothetical protein
MPIMVNNAQRPIGFKFILPASYPNSAPYVYLDEVENQQVVSLIDYVDAGNRIRCEYINMWAQRYQDIQYRASLNLNQLLYEVYQLYKQAPPLSFDEIFGTSDNNQASSEP